MNIYGIIKQDGPTGASYFLEVAAGHAYDTRAGHDHRRSLVPRPATREEAKAVLDAAQAANMPAEASREPGVFRVSFQRPVALARQYAAGRQVAADVDHMLRLIDPRGIFNK